MRQSQQTPRSRASPKTSPEEAFGAILRERRLQRKLTQEDVAAVGLIDRTYVSLLERGLRQPSLSTIINIAPILDMTPGELVDEVIRRITAQRP